MNNIDKIVREALNGYEAPFDSAMWDKVSDQLSPMEDAFRDTLENHEAPYNPAAWSAIKNKIGSSWSLFQWLGGAAAIALIATAVVFWPANESSQNADANLALTVQNELAEQNDLNNTADIAIDNDVNANETIAVEASSNNQAFNGSAPENSITFSTRITPSTPQAETDSSSAPEDNSHEFAEPGLPKEDDFIESSVADPLNAEFKASAYNVCSGTTILFNPKVSKAGTNHVWNFGDGSSSGLTNPSHNYTAAGIFTVVHTVRENNSNTVLASETQTVTVNALPSALIAWNQPVENLPTINFNALTEATDQVLWTVDGAVVSDKSQYQQTLRQKGEHVIELSVTNAQGCKQASKEVIEIEEDYNLFAPTVFTPNFDGNNDVFIPVALTLLDKKFEMFIYDIEGHLLFQTNNANNAWDGRDARSHVDAEQGVYVWFITLINENGEQEIYRGQVLLAR